MTIVKIKDLPENRDMLAKISYCGALPTFEGFKFCDGYIELSFENIEERPVHITEKAFLQFFKDVYNCAVKGVYVGPVDTENLFVSNGRLIVVPSLDENLNIVNGRIENPLSFFTTIRTFAQSFKNASPFLMNVFKNGIPAIIEIMKDLNLDIPSSKLFLPSLGIWRHGPLLEKIRAEKGFVHVPINDGGIFSKFLNGEVISSVDEIIDHVKATYDFSANLKFNSTDPSTLAFFFKTEADKSYVFNCGDSVEMMTFVNALIEFKKGIKVVAFHDPVFDCKDGKRIEFPAISPKELDWFFGTFFGSDFVFDGDSKTLFEASNGENFAISKFIRDGQWSFENGKWHIKPQIPVRLSAVSYLLMARKLMKTGEKPYLGLELVNVSSNIAHKNIEAFESARAFFHKVIGDYEHMIDDLKRADVFGERAFRNAYFGIVMAMNGFDHVLTEEKSSTLVEICRQYARLVKNGNGYGDIHELVLHPIAELNDEMSRRIEVMARNYIGIMHLDKNENDEAIDEFETALAMAHEENFKDLIPLIDMNIGYTLSNISPRTSKERLETALEESLEEGLLKIFQFINLAMTENFLKMGNFTMAKKYLDMVESLPLDLKQNIEFLKKRIALENLDYDDSSDKPDDETRMFDFVKALYVDDEKNALEILKSIKTEEAKYLKNVAEDPIKLVETITLPESQFAIYFISKLKSVRALKMMKRYGERLYREGFITRAIFYEEQLAKMYKIFGWEKSSHLHFEISAGLAQNLSLYNRAATIRKNLKSAEKITEFLNIPSSLLCSVNLESSKAVIEFIASDVAKHLKRTVLCTITGVENISYICDENGIARETNGEIKIDPWSLNDEQFVYDFSLQGGDVYIQIDRKNADLDMIIVFLDMMEPLYKLRLEKVISSKLSDLDQLTNLYTRRYIFERFYEEVERARRYGEFLSVAMIDIDDFKRINDSYGHDVGDEVLKKVADTLGSSVRKIDIIGRYGGEEFLVIFPHTPIEQSLKSAQRMLKSVRENYKWMKLTISIGIAELTSSCNNVEQLVKCADMALYRAKSAGKNRIVKHVESEV